MKLFPAKENSLGQGRCFWCLVKDRDAKSSWSWSKLRVRVRVLVYQQHTSTQWFTLQPRASGSLFHTWNNSFSSGVKEMQRSTWPELAIKRASQKLIVMQLSHVTLVLSLTMFTACSVPSRSTFTLRRPIVFYGTVTMVITGGRGYYAGRSS